MTLKTWDKWDLKKHVEDTVVIPEEEDKVGMSARRMKTWDES